MNTLQYSVRDLPAVYSIHARTPFSFLKSYVSDWIASYEGHTIGICANRTDAEDACRIHAQESECFA